MSVRTTSSSNDAICDDSAANETVELIIRTRDKDLGGFSVRRALPTRERRMVGPWIFFDHMGPAEFPAGEGINVRPHPHINLATVTYLFEGEILHRDSLGNAQLIKPGAVNLMVAGHGIVHSERERPEVRDQAHRLDGLQLWLALPEADEEMQPEFIHYPAECIPEVNVQGVRVRVIKGSAFGVTSPVKTFADTLYLEANLRSGQRLSLAGVEEQAVYIAKGGLRIDATDIPEHAMAVIRRGESATLTATADTRIAVIGGESMGHRHIEWNFVSSRAERIGQAKADWRGGRFPKVPGDEEEFIPLPE